MRSSPFATLIEMTVREYLIKRYKQNIRAKSKTELDVTVMHAIYRLIILRACLVRGVKV
jgi:hypothetical protein